MCMFVSQTSMCRVTNIFCQSSFILYSVLNPIKIEEPWGVTYMPLTTDRKLVYLCYRFYTMNYVRLLAIDCHQPPSFSKTSSIFNSTLFGEDVTYSCDEEGYEVVGNDTLSCTENGTWSDITIVCRPIVCDPVPNLSNALHSASTTTLEFGTIVTYECDEVNGFVMEGQSEVICMANKTWTMLPSCQVANCTEPPNIQFGDSHIIVRPLSFGAKVNYTCHPYHQLNGSDVIECVMNGSQPIWTPEPSCNAIACGTRPQISNGTIAAQTTSTLRMDNASVEYSCAEGFNMSGSSLIYCRDDGSWEPPPTCLIIDCMSPPLIENGSLVTNDSGSVNTFSYDTTYNATVTYDCGEGFNVTGDAIATCTANGTWTNPPHCSLIQCGVIPTISDGFHTNGTTHYGSHVNYTCQSGYRLVGNATISCLLDASWSSTPVCELDDCGPAPNVTNAKSNATNITTYETKVRYECYTGYEMTHQDAVITCEKTGQWGIPPVCSVKDCGTPHNVSHATANYVNASTTYGSTVEYACDTGYELTSNTSNITCMPSGNWSLIPVCELKDCGVAPNIAHGTFSAAETPMVQTYGATVNYTCATGYHVTNGSLSITCQASGNWSAVPSCQIKQCGVIPTVTYAVIDSETNDTTYGTTVNYTCITGYRLNSNTSHITCLASGDWSSSPSCRIVDCGTIPIAPFADVIGSGQTTYESIITYVCQQGFVQSGNDVISCQADGKWSGNGPTCTLTTTTPAPTQAPCTKQIQYIEQPETKDENITMNVTDTGDGYKTSYIRCQGSGLTNLKVVYGCAKANETAGYIWWDVLCTTRPRRRRPPIVTGPVFERPKRAPQEAPAADVIGSFEVAIALSVIGLIILLDMVTLSRQLSVMKGNIRAWIDNGYKRTTLPKRIKVKSAKVTTEFTMPQASVSTKSGVELQNSSRPATRSKLLMPAIKTKPIVPATPSISSPTPKPMHVATNSATPNSFQTNNGDTWRSAMALRRGHQAFRSARSKPAGKEAKLMNKEMVDTWRDLHVDPEYFLLPNGKKAKKVYLA